MGFFSSTRVSESESELSEPHSAVFLVKGYESAVTAVISDSEDDLFFLEGKFCSQLAAFLHMLQLIIACMDLPCNQLLSFFHDIGHVFTLGNCTLKE